MTTEWRVIPSTIDTAKGTVLVYSVEELPHGMYAYCYREDPIEKWFDESGDVRG